MLAAAILILILIVQATIQFKLRLLVKFSNSLNLDVSNCPSLRRELENRNTRRACRSAGTNWKINKNFNVNSTFFRRGEENYGNQGKAIASFHDYFQLTTIMLKDNVHKIDTSANATKKVERKSLIELVFLSCIVIANDHYKPLIRNIIRKLIFFPFLKYEASALFLLYLINPFKKALMHSIIVFPQFHHTVKEKLRL